jgi:energy-converting hydrogenase A subunit M
MSLAHTLNTYKPSAKIRTYDTADVFELMKSHDKELTLCDLVDILKQNALEEAEEMSQSLRRGS